MDNASFAHKNNLNKRTQTGYWNQSNVPYIACFLLFDFFFFKEPIYSLKANCFQDLAFLNQSVPKRLKF